MRIFIAIDFDENIKGYFENIKNQLKSYCIKGHFTNIENFHLTLQFIGELEEANIPKVLNAMEETVSKHSIFNLTISNLGNFKKGNSNILWVGTNYSKELLGLYKELSLNLNNQGISFDEKPLKPHITLGRQILLKKDINELINLMTINKIIIPVNTITLMESKRINDKLTYSPLFKINLIENI